MEGVKVFAEIDGNFEPEYVTDVTNTLDNVKTEKVIKSDGRMDMA